METYFIGLLVLIAGILFSLCFKKENKLKFTMMIAVLASILTSYSAIKVLCFDNLSYTFYLNSVFQNITFELDKLSAFFVLFISVMTSLSIIYANGYLKPYIEKNKDISAHCIFLLMLLTSMLMVVTVQNALFFIVIWEIMSLSSFFLVIFESEKTEVLKAGIKYLVYMHVSVVFLIILFALLSIISSSLNFADFKIAISQNHNFSNLIFLFAFIGFGAKAGFVPFHNWLPDAHPAAPSHVSAIMSGVMIKTGIYGILRILDIITIPNASAGYFVLIISVISALYGVLYAIGQHDIKKLLAYHSIENISIIGIGIGVGMLGLTYDFMPAVILGFSGAILHTLNHSIFKELLFLAAGAVYNKTHIKNIELLGGLVKVMPKTTFFFLVASVAICGLPPLNGFISEFLIYFGILNGLTINNIMVLLLMLFALVSLALVGTMAILCFTKLFSVVFLGSAKTEAANSVKDDVNFSFVFPMAMLTIFIFLIGLFPKYSFDLALKPVSLFISDIQVQNIEFLLQNISIVFFVMITLIVLVFLFKLKFKNKYEKHTTWGCGYNKPLIKAQYSASSYASPFLTMVKPFFKRIIDVKKPKTIFPKDAHYELHFEDIEEAYFVLPVLKSIEQFFIKFEKIQNGNIQQYISYGILFLLAALTGVILLG